MAARESVERDLKTAPSLELKRRQRELIALLRDSTRTQPLVPELWRLVLSELPPDKQRLLAAIYDELQRSSEATLDEGDELEDLAARVSEILGPMEDMLAHATGEPSSGTGDYDALRRTLSVEVEWGRGDDDGEMPHPVGVLWRDGYESVVATMTGDAVEDQFCWILEIDDPAPGRSETRVTPLGSRSARDAAIGELDSALEWAARELGDHYIIVRAPQDT